MNEKAPPAATPIKSLNHRVLRLATSLLWVALGVAVTLLVGLAFASALAGGAVITGVLATFAVGAAAIAIWRLPCTRTVQLAVSYAVFSGVLFYLVHDEPSVRQPPRIEPATPSFPGAEESYAVLMRYGRQQPLGRDFRFTASPQFQQGRAKWKPGEPEWTTWLTANRAEIETGWTKLEPVRAWWSEVNAFDRIGDFTPPRSDSDILAFQPVRAVFQHACAIASLHALDGNEAAAIETLLPILDLSRKLQPASRTLVRSMIGIAGEKMALETISFILGSTILSPDGRARLANSLQGRATPEDGARRLVTIEYEWAMAVLNDPGAGMFPLHDWLPRWVYPVVRYVALVVYNPHRTLNVYCDMMVDMQGRVNRRDPGDIDAKVAKLLETPPLQFKNFAGPYLLRMITPNYNKLLDSYWKTEDSRMALLNQLGV